MTGLADLPALGLADLPGLDLLAGLDLAALTDLLRRLQDEAVQQDQLRRLARRIEAEGVGLGMRIVAEAVDERASAVAEAHRIVSLVRDFVRDVGTGGRAPPAPDPAPARLSPLRWLRRTPATPEAPSCA